MNEGIFTEKARPETDIANKHIAGLTLSSNMDKQKQKRCMRLGNTFQVTRWGGRSVLREKLKIGSRCNTDVHLCHTVHGRLRTWPRCT